MQNETIVDRVVQRLKLQPLGDLITEEDLHDVVKQAIPKVFFEPRVTKDGYHTNEKEPVIHEIMRELLQNHARTAVEKWIAENGIQLMAHWKEIMDQGLMKYVRQSQEAIIDMQVREVIKNSLLQTINADRTRMGLPPIYL